MLDNKKMMIMCIVQYVLILSYHLVFSLLYGTFDQTIKVGVWSICVLLILVVFCYIFNNQIDLVVYVIIASILISVTYVGVTLGTLSFGILIFLTAGMILSMFLNPKYIYLWSISSVITLILYTIIWPQMILNMVHSIFLYYGYILAYVIGLFYLIVLVNAAKKNFKQMEETAKNAELENASKNLFWANISNEIRTPMNVINGMSRLLKTESLNTRAQEYTEQIENASDMLLNIVTDTLELSQLETDTYELRNTAYDLYRLIHNTVMEVSEKSSAENVKFSYSINPKVPNVLIGDSLLLNKVLLRFIDNLVVFSESSDIRLFVGMEDENPKETVNLKIEIETLYNSENGYNFDAIFDEDILDYSKKSTEQEQLSLSLKLCKIMLNKVGGTLIRDNKDDNKLHFVITFNQIIGAESELIREYEYAIKTLNQNWKAPSSNVLIVDDTPTNLKLISGMIRLYGINPDNALSGKECLSMMENKKYDLVFLDYMMPEMNGVDTLKKIKAKALENDNFNNVPVVCLSAKSLQRDKAKFIDLGFVGFISKPIDDRELEDFLMKYLTKERSLPENNY